ncbi:hypothetical protein Cni_G10719 [Canna indica]|uniref:Bifunctional inhibitor/plant lipid transfer protein/seed storage helical domain-containing protein n=1 Tax=Canna indica TaxID=4628 RepID=A0AAQ3K6I9_9LILI|nr:hypothetical protein Cni_G10719 [Canna indica]
MDATAKHLHLLLLGVLAVACFAAARRAEGAGECGRVPVDRLAFQVVQPCSAATRDAQAVVPGRCCLAVQRVGQNPNCLCAVMLSDTAKSTGAKPEVAITIPKRCNLADRPVGYKCGGRLYVALNWRWVDAAVEMISSSIVWVDAALEIIS